MPPPAFLVRFGPRLPRRTVRLRLTALYGVLFLLSSAALLAVINFATRSQRVTRHVPRRAAAQAAQTLAGYSHQLLIVSLIGLAIMVLASVVLGWLVAGRILRPLRAMTAATRQISEDDLHRRLALPGAGDELKDLADTIDGLLARLQAAFDAQRQFVANASHELRTPLTLERAMLEVALADPAATAETLRSTCQDVLAAGQQQERLIEALLTLARSQRGLDRRDPLDLAAITSSVLHAREPDAAARGLALSASITTTLIRGDARLLERLAANLIDNAIRHNIPHGQIGIQVTTSGGHPTLTITNTGPVIPAGQATRLLQPFQRLPAGRPADDDGLGLGLSIVAAITKAHRATLTVNPGPHGGLGIVIRFPAGAAAPTPPRDGALTAP